VHADDISRKRVDTPAVAVSTDAVAIGVRERPGQSLEKLTAADLTPTKSDHGHQWGEFDVGEDVIVFFHVLVLTGTIVSKSKRNKTFTIELHKFGQHKVTTTRQVTVSHGCIEPIDSFDLDP
jgi:hypothetical protein